MEDKQQDAVLGGATKLPQVPGWLGPSIPILLLPPLPTQTATPKGFRDLFTLCLPQAEVTETQRTMLSPPPVGRYKRPAASWGPNLPKKHTLVSKRALKGGSWGLLHPGFGEVRALGGGPTLPGGGEQTQKLEAVGETTQPFDKVY